MVEQWTENPRVGSSILPLGTDRSVAQLARALRLGRRGRRFESFHSDIKGQKVLNTKSSAKFSAAFGFYRLYFGTKFLK